MLRLRMAFLAAAMIGLLLPLASSCGNKEKVIQRYLDGRFVDDASGQWWRVAYYCGLQRQTHGGEM